MKTPLLLLLSAALTKGTPNPQYQQIINNNGQFSSPTEQIPTNPSKIIDSSPLLSFHRNIVEIESISGNEKNAGDFVFDFLASNNFTVEKQLVVPASNGTKDRFNVYAYIGKNRHPDIILTSHLDTVPPFIPYSLHVPESSTPFDRKSLVIAGRGAVDAKASVSAIVFAALETLSENPDTSLGLLFDVGEENSGVGIKHFSNSDLNLSPSSFHTVIFGEPTELSLVAGHKGGAGFRITAKGRAAHSGYPWLGESAISAILPVLAHLDTLEDTPPEKGGLLRSEKFGKSTLNIGYVRGGVAINVVPATAEASVLVRLAAGTPEDTGEIIRKAVEDVTGGDGSVEVEFTGGSPPQHLDADVEGFDVITVNYGTDVSGLKIHDSDEVTVKRYLYGPGSIHVAHSSDETITVGDLEEAVEGYKKLISAAVERY